MKILMVVPDTNMGGITTAAVNLSNELQTRGNEVVFLDMSGAFLCADRLNKSITKSKLTGISHYWKLGKKDFQGKGTVKKVALSFLGIIKKLTVKSGLWYKLIFKKYKKYGDFDVAIAFRQCAPCYSFVLNKVNAKKKIGFVHGELKFMGDISSWKKYMDKFDKVAYVSNAVKDEFVTAFPELKINACTIYNMFDVGKIKFLALNENPIAFDKSIKNIVTVARVDNAFKRINWVPEICKKIIEKTEKPFHWYIVGDGPDFNETESLIKECGVQDYVTLVGSTNNPYSILKDADFSVLLSKSEAYPMTVIESFILGVPIVVSRFASIEEMMENGKCGLIAESTKDSLLNSILCFLTDNSKYSECKEFLAKKIYTNDKEYVQFLEAVGRNICIQ